MLKFLLIVVACEFIGSLVAHEIYENTAEGVIFQQKVDSKIATGIVANKTLKLDYALISVTFINQAQICGGTLIKTNYVLTSATCLQDPVEGVASYVYVALGGATKPTLTHEKIVIHESYDATTYANDIALLKLSKSVVADGKKIALATLSAIATPDVYDKKVLVYCGWGSIANKPTPPRGLMCTTLYGTTIAICGANTNVVCTKWAGKDNNVCPGDFGGPLYEISGTTQTVVGIATYSPDLRPGTPCLDGHATEHSQVGGFSAWITTNAV